MTQEIFVPSFGESIREARIGTLHVSNGQFVKEGQDILDLETDKLNQTIQAPCSGVISWQVSLHQTVAVGQTLASITEEPETIVSIFTATEEPEKQPQKIEPKAIPQEKKGAVKPLSPLRKKIAERLHKAKTEMVMLTTFQEVDLHRVIEIRNEYKDEFFQKFQVKLGYMSFFVSAVVRGLQEFPIMNSSIDEHSNVITSDHFDIGVAVSTEKGVIVPILRDAQKLSYSEIETIIEAMAKKARSGTLEAHDIQGGTFTITNGGIFGSLFSTPIINPPQSAILGMHTIQKRAVVVDDQIVIRPMMYLALTYDHRLIDGKEAVGFLSTLKKELEEPDRLLIRI